MSTRKRLEPMMLPCSFRSLSSILASISTFSPIGIMPITVAVPPTFKQSNACAAAVLSPIASNA